MSPISKVMRGPSSERLKRKKQKEKAPPPKLDHIDPHTVGRFDAKQWEKLSHPWSWMLGARQMLLEGAYKTVDPEEISHMPHVVCSCDAQRLLEELAGAPTGDSVGEVSDEALPIYNTKNKVRLPLLRKMTPSDVNHEICGLFLTPKKDDTYRLVFDARRANLRLKRLTGFRLFSLDELLRSISSLMKKGPTYAWTCDFRHYFYQLRLHMTPQSWFTIVDGRGRKYFPNVWPMGFHSSPPTAQCISWTVVLARMANDGLLGVSASTEIMLPGHPEGEAMSETEPQHTLTFAGVEFSERGWRSSSGDRPIPEWRGTRRQALQTAGTLLWDIRVRQGNLRDHPQLRLLYREIGTHVNGTGRDGLDVGHRRHSLQYCMGCPTAPGAPPEAGEQGSDPC